MGRGVQRIVFGMCVAAVAVVAPAIWIVGAWWLGPRLDHANLPFLTPVLVFVVVVGAAVSVAVLARWLVLAEARLAVRAGREPVVRIRPPRRRQIRPEVPVLDDPPREPVEPRRRLAALALLVLMVAGTVVLLVGAPTAMVWLASQMAGTTQPTFGPYVFVLVATSVAIAGGFRLLRPIQGVYARVTGAATARRRRQTAWLASYGAERGVRRAERGLEAVMVAAVMIAALFLLLWFFALGDPVGIAERISQA
jgi:hypothetical protein